MKLSDGVIKAYETRWSMINTFTVSFYFYNGNYYLDSNTF